MAAGIPGTGLGGILYLALAFAMPVRELWRTLRGRGQRHRWAAIGTGVGLAAGILLGLACMAWLMLQGLELLKRWTSDGSAMYRAADGATRVMIPTLVIAPVVIFALMFGSIHMARLILRWRRHRRHRGESGPGAPVVRSAGDECRSPAA